MESIFLLKLVFCVGSKEWHNLNFVLSNWPTILWDGRFMRSVCEECLDDFAKFLTFADVCAWLGVGGVDHVRVREAFQTT